MSDAMQAEKVAFDYGEISGLHIELLEIGAIRLSYKGNVLVKTPEALFNALASQAEREIKLVEFVLSYEGLETFKPKDILAEFNTQ